MGGEINKQIEENKGEYDLAHLGLQVTRFSYSPFNSIHYVSSKRIRGKVYLFLWHNF